MYRDKERAEEWTRHWEKLQPDERRLQIRGQLGGVADVQKTTWLFAEAAAVWSGMEANNTWNEKNAAEAVGVMEWNDDGLRRGRTAGKYRGGGRDRSFCAAAGQEGHGSTDRRDREEGLPA